MEQNTTLGLVLDQLKDSIELLNIRHEEMATEVVRYFNEHNLEAIEKLMNEKKLSMELQQDLKAILEKWTSNTNVMESEIRDVS